MGEGCVSGQMSMPIPLPGDVLLAPDCHRYKVIATAGDGLLTLQKQGPRMRKKIEIRPRELQGWSYAREAPEPSPVTRHLNPMRQKLKRFLHLSWSQNRFPLSPLEVRDGLGMSHAEWTKQSSEVRRWIEIAGWKECSRKLSRNAPSRKGFWPPIAPAPRIDEWSEYD